MINGNGYNNFYSNTMINGKTDFDDISSQQFSELKMMDSPMFSSLVRSVLFSSVLFCSLVRSVLFPCSFFKVLQLRERERGEMEGKGSKC